MAGGWGPLGGICFLQLSKGNGITRNNLSPSWPHLDLGGVIEGVVQLTNHFIWVSSPPLPGYQSIPTATALLKVIPKGAQDDAQPC